MPQERAPRHGLLPWLRTCPWALVVAAAAAGVLLVGWSYAISGRGGAPGAYYAVFWLGMLLAVLPCVVRLTRRSATRSERAAALLLLALLTAVPKFLRNPDQPLYHDEYAHWRQALDVLVTGKILQPNSLIPIVQFFPGTSTLTVAVQQLTGLPVWSSGQLVVTVLHVASVFAVLVLGEVHLRSARAGAIAALVYAVNPSAIYFDTQYAYESVAMALFLWVLAATSLASRARGRSERYGYVGIAVVCSAACVVTHHLTTLFLIAALGVVCVASGMLHFLVLRVRYGRWEIVPAPRLRLGVWVVVLAATVALAALWVGLIAQATISYLSPYLGGSVQQLLAMAQPHPDAAVGREVLAPTVEPGWERLLTALAPLLVGVTCLVGVLRLWRARLGWSAVTSALVVFGLIYFPSVPFVLAPSGAEGARRSWGFTYVGIALLVAVVVARVQAERRPSQAPSRARRRRPLLTLGRWSAPVALVAFTVLMIGNVGGGLNDPYRFPGPFRWGTDTRSASDEARTVAQQIGRRAGRVRVVADSYTALQLAAYGGLRVAAPSTGFPAWNLTQTDQDPSDSLARMLYTSGYDYLVVDVRMAEQAPFNGANWGRDDPLLGRATPPANLERLDHVPWASLVMTTEHLRVYRLDLPRIGATVVGSR